MKYIILLTVPLALVLTVSAQPGAVYPNQDPVQQAREDFIKQQIQALKNDLLAAQAEQQKSINGLAATVTAQKGQLDNVQQSMDNLKADIAEIKRLLSMKGTTVQPPVLDAWGRTVVPSGSTLGIVPAVDPFSPTMQQPTMMMQGYGASSSGPGMMGGPGLFKHPGGLLGRLRARLFPKGRFAGGRGVGYVGPMMSVGACGPGG